MDRRPRAALIVCAGRLQASIAVRSRDRCSDDRSRALIGSIAALTLAFALAYVTCMASKRSTTVRLDPEDVRALQRARRDGISSSHLIRQGLRIVAARYYGKRKPPDTRLFESIDPKLGSEERLFRDLER